MFVGTGGGSRGPGGQWSAGQSLSSCAPARRYPLPHVRGCCGPPQSGSLVTVLSGHLSPACHGVRAAGGGVCAEVQGVNARWGGHPGSLACAPPPFCVRHPAFSLPGADPLPWPSPVGPAVTCASAFAGAGVAPVEEGGTQGRGSQTLASAPVTRSTAPSKLFPLRKLHGAWPGGSGPAWGKETQGRYPFCASWQYGGVGAEALPLGSMRYKHDSEDNEDEDMNLQKIPVYKKM